MCPITLQNSAALDTGITACIERREVLSKLSSDFRHAFNFIACSLRLPRLVRFTTFPVEMLDFTNIGLQRAGNRTSTAEHCLCILYGDLHSSDAEAEFKCQCCSFDYVARERIAEHGPNLPRT